MIDEHAEKLVERARNVSADDLNKLIDWVAVKGQKMAGNPSDAVASKVPAALPASTGSTASAL